MVGRQCVRPRGNGAAGDAAGCHVRVRHERWIGGGAGGTVSGALRRWRAELGAPCSAAGDYQRHHRKRRSKRILTELAFALPVTLNRNPFIPLYSQRLSELLAKRSISASA